MYHTIDQKFVILYIAQIIQNPKILFCVFLSTMVIKLLKKYTKKDQLREKCSPTNHKLLSDFYFYFWMGFRYTLLFINME